MSRYIFWLFSFFLCISSGVTYTSAMTEEYASADDAQEPADGAAQGEAVEGVVTDENGAVEAVQEDEVTRELKTKQHVRNLVDSLLKINKQVEVRSDDPKVKRLMKEQNIGKQIDRLREDIRDLEKTLNSHYTEIKKSSVENEEKESTNKTKSESNSAKEKRSNKATYKHQAKSWRKARRSSSTSNRGRRSNIHTVKNVNVPNTNSYLQRINQRGPATTSSKSSVTRSSYSYRVKCYGKNGSCGSTKTTKAAPAATTSPKPQAYTTKTKEVSYFNPNCSTRSCG